MNYPAIFAFIKWLRDNDWHEHSSKEYWYKGQSWPPDDWATEEDLFKKFFGN